MQINTVMLPRQGEQIRKNLMAESCCTTEMMLMPWWYDLNSCTLEERLLLG